MTAFLDSLNVVHNALPADPAKRYDVAEKFALSVSACREVQDAFVAALKVPTREATEKDGSYWLAPKRGYGRVVRAVQANCLVTEALTIDAVFEHDPSKVDPRLSRIGGQRAQLKRTRRGMRLDVDNRLRMMADPNHAPRMDDPRFHDLMQEGLAIVGAPEPYRRACAIAYCAGGRWVSVSSLTIFDVLVGDKGRARYWASHNKGDKEGERSFVMQPTRSEEAATRAWIKDGRAELTGVSLELLETMAKDPSRHDELKRMPLLTENGVDPLPYHRMWRLLRRAAETMDLFIADDEYYATGRKRFVSFHYLRHEYVHRRLDRMRGMATDAARKAEKADIIAYMRWSGEAMFTWYSRHHVLKHASIAAEDFNDEQDEALKGTAHSPSGIVAGNDDEHYDMAMEAFG